MSASLEAPAPAPAAAAEDSSVGFWVRGGAIVLDSLALWGVGLALALAGVPHAGAFGLAAQIAYNAAMIAVYGQTLGKMAAGARVVALDGSAVRPGPAIVRALAQYVSGLILGLGYLIAAFRKDKRALHDFAASTRVVYLDGVGSGRKAAAAALAALAVAGFAAAVAVLFLVKGGGSRFNELMTKSADAYTKAHLGSVRSATLIYFGDHEGEYPPDLETLQQAAANGSQYLAALPQAQTKEHGKTDGWERYGGEACGAPTAKRYKSELNPAALRDTGRWGYVADKASACWGQVFVDCTHSDSRGKPWHSY